MSDDNVNPCRRQLLKEHLCLSSEFCDKKSLKIPKWLWQVIIWLGLWYLTPLSTIFHWSRNQGWTDNTMVKIEVGSILLNLKFSVWYVVDHRLYFCLFFYFLFTIILFVILPLRWFLVTSFLPSAVISQMSYFDQLDQEKTYRRQILYYRWCRLIWAIKH